MELRIANWKHKCHLGSKSSFWVTVPKEASWSAAELQAERTKQIITALTEELLGKEASTALVISDVEGGIALQFPGLKPSRKRHWELFKYSVRTVLVHSSFILVYDPLRRNYDDEVLLKTINGYPRDEMFGARKIEEPIEYDERRACSLAGRRNN